LADLGLVEPSRYQSVFRAMLAAGPRHHGWSAVWPALSVEAFVRSHWGTDR